MKWNSMLKACTCVILLGFLSGSGDVCAATSMKAVITDNAVSIYSEATTTSTRLRDVEGKIVFLDENEEAVYLGEEKSADGNIWCKIKLVDEDGVCLQGYVPKSDVTLQEQAVYETDKAFEKYLKKQGFPESYKDALRQLHQLYPEWVFEAKKINKTWEEAVASQTTLGKNLVSVTSYESYKNKENGGYNEKTDSYVLMEKGTCVSASAMLVSYYMDPRNFLDEENIFQFYSLSYDSKEQTIKNMANVMQGTYLETTAEGIQGYQTLLKSAAKQSKVNPYYLIWRMVQFAGETGNEATKGEFERYKGIYNLYGLGAQSDNMMNLMVYAAATDTTSLRPWNTVENAVVGGAKIIAQDFIAQNQTTFYNQKFDLAGQLFVHQSSNQLYEAAANGQQIATFLKNNKNQQMTFEIPVYKNMPETTELVIEDESGNAKLQELEVKGYQLTPSFNPDITTYYIQLEEGDSELDISATSISDSTVISGTGKVAADETLRVCKVVGTAENGEKVTYYLHTFTKPEVTYQYAISKKITVTSAYLLDGSGDFYNIAVGTTADEFLASVSLNAGQAKLYNKDGELAQGVLTTGCTYVVYNSKEKVLKKMAISVKGDVNGDGLADVKDILFIHRHFSGITKLKGIYLKAGDVNLGMDKITGEDLDAMSRLVVHSNMIGAKVNENAES